MGRILVLIGCIVAALLIIDSLRNDPDVHPVFQRAQHAIGGSLGTLFSDPGDAAIGTPEDCADVDDRWFQLDLKLAPTGNEVGDLIVDSSDGLVSTLVITRVDLTGGATKVDLQTSLSIAGVFAHSTDRVRFREIVPPAIDAKRLTAPDGSAITMISLCYRDPNGALPTPRPTRNASPVAVPTNAASPVVTAASTATASNTPVPASATPRPTVTPSGTNTATA
ncbi:MAG TPA: hypothetical protein PK691_11050, partial [Thermomicrobiales bacterium]|nr:hypothetical protein [Thermomicrobiales bacterium]